ncbi:MAG TPA: DUF2784 domain-containing protein [Mycobacteriales bacterium]|nr:DUF2784 domain-containing protein [Mycobacteriales bacterium]
MAYQVLADVVLVLHLTFVAYVAFGGFLAWRWPRALLPHLAAAAWAGLGLAVPLACPLTAWQDWLRRRAGQPSLAHGFIDTYIVGPVVPPAAEVPARWAVAGLVITAWFGASGRRLATPRHDRH